MDTEVSASLKPIEQKAVVFTHFGGLQYGKDEAEWLRKKPAYLAEYTDILTSYLLCANEGKQLGLVYVYIDWAVQKTVLKITGANFSIDPKQLGRENDLVGLLEIAEYKARESLGLGQDHPPQFRYVGLSQLVNLLNNLMEVGPELIKFLYGARRKLFTYDSPKFVEAVIRLVRGSFPHLAASPVIRIDEDAKPTAGFISRLLETYVRVSAESRFFFFSGTYGDPKPVDPEVDPINDFAVRVHWLATVPQVQRPKLTLEQAKLAKMFLADLNDLGAPQVPDSTTYYSAALRDLHKTGHPAAKASGNPQVISGAGLIMSAKAVGLFPPFMNFENRTIWVDDHLKRLVHEVSRDLGSGDPECIGGAKIRQVRHEKLEKEDILKPEGYFDRLLRGCLFHNLITDHDGEPTEYAKLLTNIVRYRIRKLTKRKAWRQDLAKLAEQRYREVMRCWHSPEFGGTPLYDWVGSLKENHRTDICDAVAKDALSYVDLLLKWPIFTRAIDRLQVAGNYWLFVPTS